MFFSILSIISCFKTRRSFSFSAYTLKTIPIVFPLCLGSLNLCFNQKETKIIRAAKIIKILTKLGKNSLSNGFIGQRKNPMMITEKIMRAVGSWKYSKQYLK